MDFEEHCKRTEFIFGDRHERVHRWLDEFSKDYSIGERYKHRKYRHHLEGIYKAGRVLGYQEMLVALFHVMDDNEGDIPLKSDYEASEYAREMYGD